MPLHTKAERAKHKERIKKAASAFGRFVTGGKKPTKGLQTDVRTRQREKEAVRQAVEQDLERQRRSKRRP